jgi:hypothetical protein
VLVSVGVKVLGSDWDATGAGSWLVLPNLSGIA